MILLDGKKLSEKILAELKDQIARGGKPLRLAVVVVGENPVIEKFIAQKRKVAEFIGAEFRVYEFDAAITTNELRKRIAEIVHEKKNTGVIIQLPLPAHINTQYILSAVPLEKDADMLSARSVGNFVVGKSRILPPVVGAIKAFFDEYGIDYKNMYSVILGAGSLVGRPVAFWLLNEGAAFGVLRRDTKRPEEFISRADIVISGVGKPKFIAGGMVKDGVIVIDAGTSESEGKLAGDVDFDSVSQKASYITPVPGGIGPLTVAMVFRNLFELSRQKR